MLPLSIVAANYLQNSTLGQNAKSADAEDKNINDIINEKTSLTDKARYMDANTETAQAVKNVFEAGVVGSKIDVQFKFKDKDGKFNKKLNDLWEAKFKLWSESQFCTTQGKYHFRNILAQIIKAEKSTEGEVLVLHHFDGTKQWKPKNSSKSNKEANHTNSSPFSYKIQLLETSMIDDSKDRDIVKDRSGKIKDYAIVGGLMIGEWDDTIGIYIYDDQSKSTSTFYRKGSFTLYFDPHLRISQYRGISKLSGIIGSVQDTITYKENELTTASLATKSQFVHKTSLIAPYIKQQQNTWKQIFTDKGLPLSLAGVQSENQANSPVVYVDKDDEYTKLSNSNQSSQYEAFVKTGNVSLATNFGISKQTIVKGDGDSVFAVVKAEKLDNGIRFEIDQDNLIKMCIVHIVNNFIETHAIEYGLKDFRLDKYKYLYQYKITLGSKTELDEVKSANARKINKEQNVIDDYQAAQELGNDLDTLLENNTRARTKKIQEITKTILELKTLNEEANKSGMNFKLDENLNIIQDMDYNKEADNG